MTKRQTLLNIKGKFLNYFSEAEHNILHVKQLASFGLMTTLLIIYLMAVNDILDKHMWSHFWKMSAIYLMPPAGKETAIPLGLYNDLDPLLVGVSIVFFDIMIAVGTLTNWWIVEGVVKYLPPFKYHGKEASAESWLRKLQEKTTKYRERTSYKFMVPITIFAFYLIPFQGGSISTSIIGVLLGYRWRTILFIIAMASATATTFWILGYLDIVRIL